ncbi:hypothetical protein IC582_006820 [Cucumis melo]
MEAAAAARGASLTMHSPQLSRQEWRAIADKHSARDTADEEMERAKLTQSDERTIYEQGREPLDVDFCSISIDGNPDNYILQRRSMMTLDKGGRIFNRWRLNLEHKLLQDQKYWKCKRVDERTR